MFPHRSSQRRDPILGPAEIAISGVQLREVTLKCLDDAALFREWWNRNRKLSKLSETEAWASDALDPRGGESPGLGRNEAIEHPARLDGRVESDTYAVRLDDCRHV